MNVSLDTLDAQIRGNFANTAQPQEFTLATPFAEKYERAEVFFTGVDATDVMQGQVALYREGAERPSAILTLDHYRSCLGTLHILTESEYQEQRTMKNIWVPSLRTFVNTKLWAPDLKDGPAMGEAYV